MYSYNATVAEVVDGDTMHVTVDLGFNITMATTLRLYGINCPEMNTPEGVAAKEAAQQWLDQHCPLGEICILTIKDRREKYGRYLATVLPRDSNPPRESLNTWLLTNGHAKVYMP